ncbi:MAG: sorbosone dehydrogenase family protein [Hyphomicrobiales bacterium]|nr:sorbosone dehydrogenase family protein [Hyphomicrobiales bacterium]
MFRIIALTVVAIALASAGLFYFSRESARLPEEQTFGPSPTIPQPSKTLFPTVNIAKASSWPQGVTPTAAPGFEVAEFAGDLDHPRWLHVLPNGDVLVAESNKTAKEKGASFSVRGFVEGLIMGQAGAKAPSANRITLLRDTDGDGVADLKTPFIEGLNSPFGMTLSGATLYVANTDAVVAFPYVEGETKITAPGEKVVDLPAGPINHHWTKDVIATPDGRALYATVGSNSNVGENGIAAEENRAAVLKIDPVAKTSTVFASGLRNPNGLSFNPETGDLWVVVNERDELGSDLVPDYMTSVKEGAFYGWPYSYYGQHVDTRVEPPRPALVAKAIPPDYALGTHTGSLGLTFDNADLLGPQFKGGAFVGQHGSWNRRPRSGYKVIFVPFTAGRPSGMPRDILTGFVGGDDDEARGRPVGVAIDGTGALLVADDVGDKVWRVTPAP